MIGQNWKEVTVQELAAGWGFSSELPDYLVITIPFPFTTNVIMKYNSVENRPFLGSYPEKWFFDNGYNAIDQEEDYTMYRMGFGC
jgi:hypothetical protein